MIDAWEINGQTVLPGESTEVKINVGRLPSDTRIHIKIQVYRSSDPGPTMLILGGVHGDEANGIEIVRRIVSDPALRSLRRGNLIAIPLLNVYGFINFNRDVPDGKDVNRSFPGTRSGSLASRVAYALTRNVLPYVDFGIDFHTGGNSRYNFPQIRYTGRDPRSKVLASMFSPPYLIRKSLIPKSLRRVALDLDIPVLVYEGGEALRFDPFAIEIAVDGVKRIMASNDMIDYESPRQRKVLHVGKTTWIRASHSGLFKWLKASGHQVKKGEPIGTISDPDGNKDAVVLAKRDGHIIGHNNAPVVNVGDALFHVGYEIERMGESLE